MTKTKQQTKHHCWKCDRNRTVDNFYRRADGSVVPKCKDCRAEYAKAHYAAKQAEAKRAAKAAPKAKAPAKKQAASKPAPKATPRKTSKPAAKAA